MPPGFIADTEGSPDDVVDGTSAEAGAHALHDGYGLLYDELRLIARRHLQHDRAGHTLSPTALVHESYVKLAALPDDRWRNRAQFFALASRAMRHILVDHARARTAGKRGGGAVQVTLHPEMAAATEPVVDLLALDQAMSRLRAVSPRLEQVVECKVFGGLSTHETADVLGTSVRTTEREWTRARTYLYKLLVEYPLETPS